MKRREAGFTLIEVLVATAIFALVISALYQGLQTGWRGLRASESEEAALAVAASTIASSGVETPLSAGTLSGTAPNGVTWQMTTRPYEGPANAANTNATQAFWIDVVVRWRAGPFAPEKSFSVTTLKLTRPS